jgi:hypothetical protein
LLLFYLFANAMLPLVFQASLSFDRMAGKAKVTDVNDAFGLVDTMSVGDLFTKKAKKNSRKAGAKKGKNDFCRRGGFCSPGPYPRGIS